MDFQAIRESVVTQVHQGIVVLLDTQVFRDIVVQMEYQDTVVQVVSLDIQEQADIQEQVVIQVIRG